MAAPEEIAVADLDANTGVEVTEAQKLDDPFLVTFKTPFDRENPKDWSNSKKWTVTDVLSATGFNRIMVSTIMAPALTTIAKDLNMNSVESVMSLSVYLLATAFGPLVIGPLSEVYGRKPILHLSNVWFLVCNIICGFANSKGLLIAFRFLAGFGASAIYSLAGGVLGDVWRPEQRGRSLGIYLLIPLLGAAVGPIIGGFVAARTTWRWIFWSTSIFQAVMVVFSVFAFHETYAPVILHRKAEAIRKETGDPRYYTAAERQHGDKTPLQVIRRSLSRPLRLLLFHPIIQLVALRSAFGYGLLYIVLSTFANLWTQDYHQSLEISGLHYLAIAFGEILGSQIGGYILDRAYKYFRNRKARVDGFPCDGIPEYRVPCMLPGLLILPLGLFFYGWTAQYRVPWPVVDIAVCFLTFGMQIAGQPLQAYIIDSYPEHTSSATAASQFVQSMTAFGFPLFAPTMYRSLGYGWGNSLLGFLAIAIGIPTPLVIWIYGARLRARAASSY